MGEVFVGSFAERRGYNDYRSAEALRSIESLHQVGK